MSAIDNDYNPELRQDYDGLLFQFRALLRLYNSTRAQLRFVTQAADDRRKQIADGATASVDSQRDANQRLTDENAQLRARVAELEAENTGLRHKFDVLMSMSAPTEQDTEKLLAKIKAEAVREAESIVRQTMEVHAYKGPLISMALAVVNRVCDEFLKYANKLESGQ